MEVAAGLPWNLRFEVERTGLVYDCRLTSGAPASGAVAYASWRSDRASTRCLGGGAAHEQRIAVEIAQRLCKCSRHAVACTVDLGERPWTEDDRASVEATACELAADLGRRLEERRIRAELAEPGEAASILAPPPELEARVAEFLATPLEDLLAAHGTAVRRAVSETFGRRVLLFAPLYLSNACLNDCAYCGFRRSADTERVKVSADRAVAEARRLAALGHRTLDLVTGEIPTDAFCGYVADVCERILRATPVRRINLNLGSLSSAQYRRLRRAGATAYHLYQETYDPDAYLAAHPRGPKRDMAARLRAPERALAAGFERVGLGVLLGLGPVAPDLARLAWHAHRLRRAHPRAGLGFSLPRVQEAGQDPALVEAARVDDETFAKALLFLRLEHPDAHLTLTTRESPALRDALLPLGVTKVSAGVCTSPVGTESPDETRQFRIQDERTPAEVAGRLRAAGLVPTFT